MASNAYRILTVKWRTLWPIFPPLLGPYSCSPYTRSFVFFQETLKAVKGGVLLRASNGNVDGSVKKPAAAAAAGRVVEEKPQHRLSPKELSNSEGVVEGNARLMEEAASRKFTALDLGGSGRPGAFDTSKYCEDSDGGGRDDNKGNKSKATKAPEVRHISGSKHANSSLVARTVESSAAALLLLPHGRDSVVGHQSVVTATHQPQDGSEGEKEAAASALLASAAAAALAPAPAPARPAASAGKGGEGGVSTYGGKDGVWPWGAEVASPAAVRRLFSAPPPQRVGAAPTASIAALWEKHTKGFGSRILAVSLLFLPIHSVALL